jgi:RNA polymerase sigma-70 factor (ECF subfamily)
MASSWLERSAQSQSQPSSAPDDAAREQALVARVQRGESAAFEQIFCAHWEPLYNYAFRYLHSADEAEDAVQTVFARIWRAHAEWRITGSLKAYLYLAVRNASHDRIARNAVARQWREKQIDALREDPSLGSAEGSDALLAASELDAAMERALAELTPKQREVYLLRIRADLTYSEIGQRLGIATKTVENHLAAAYKLLRERLRDDDR